MIPLVLAARELQLIKQRIDAVAAEVGKERGGSLHYQVGTMIELPRAALRAGEIAEHAEFFSFGTNDLTQMTLGLSRDDSGKFLEPYIRAEIFHGDPFQTLDVSGVGELVEMAAERGRKVAARPQARHLRRAWRRRRLGGVLRDRGPRLCLLLALPRADRTACRGPGGAEGQARPLSGPLDELRHGGKAALARALARAEAAPSDEATLALLDAAWAAPRAAVIGLTGPPGVGKSTLVSAFVRAWRERGRTVGVIAVDPSSKRTRGALLGDRTRIDVDPDDQGVFVRSLAARDRLGGLADLAAAAMVLMRAVYDVVLVETVGVGQSETEIAELADTVLFAVQPGSGDSLQFMKAGIVEIPDVALVTKADLGGIAERAKRDLEGALGIVPGCGAVGAAGPSGGGHDRARHRGGAGGAGPAPGPHRARSCRAADRAGAALAAALVARGMRPARCCPRGSLASVDPRRPGRVALPLAAPGGAGAGAGLGRAACRLSRDGARPGPPSAARAAAPGPGSPRPPPAAGRPRPAGRGAAAPAPCCRRRSGPRRRPCRRG